MEKVKSEGQLTQKELCIDTGFRKSLPNDKSVNLSLQKDKDINQSLQICSTLNQFMQKDINVLQFCYKAVINQSQEKITLSKIKNLSELQQKDKGLSHLLHLPWIKDVL